MKATPAQHFREECLADRGYRFLREDGEDAIWQFKGFSSKPYHTVRVKPTGETETIEITEPTDKKNEKRNPS